MAVQTNQYVITSGREIVLLDPGGAHVFPRVLANVAELVDLKAISHIFYSHQDPDVSSGITLWLSMAERAMVHISELWVRFLLHFYLIASHLSKEPGYAVAARRETKQSNRD